jgi:hypothetical protein
MVATFLTLVVVPTLYFLLERFSDISSNFIRRVKEIYWKPYPILAGERQQTERK